MFDRQRFVEDLREKDPHGHSPNSLLERLADIEQLEWDIALMEDLSDVKTILFKLVELIR